MNQLLESLQTSSNFTLLNTVLSAYQDKEDWKPFAQSEPKGLHKTRIWSSDTLEVMLLSWEAGFTTLPHDHAANGCWLKVLQGTLIETRYNTDLVAQQSTQLRDNDISFMCNNFGYHAICSLVPTWSLHVYSPPLHKTRYFSNK